jgi:hypothetical protein
MGYQEWGQLMGQTNIHQFTGDMIGKRQNMAPHANKYSIADNVFMFSFAAVITLLVEETNRYYQQYLDFLDDGPSPVPDITIRNVFVSSCYYSDGMWHM